MTFLNISLLVSLVAVGIPIALHLIARKEPKQVLFPSIRLLTQRFETNRSKVRIRRWWLLALRIAAIAAVALSLARPVVAGSLSLAWTTIGILVFVAVALLVMASVASGKGGPRSLIGSLLVAAAIAFVGAIGWGGYTIASGVKPDIDESTPVAIAIVVDNAPLSGWRDGESRQLDRLRLAAKELVMAANRESRIAVVDRSSAPAAFSLDVSSALAKLDSMEPLEIVAPIEARLEAAARLLQTTDIPSRQLVILSGLAESSFDVEAPSNSIAELIQSSGTRVTLWSSGDLSGHNRSVSIATLSDSSPAPDTAISVTAVVSMGENAPANNIDDPAPRGLNVTVECVLFPSSPALPVLRDGQIIRPEAKPVDRVNVELFPGRDVELRMALPPLPTGLHHGAIRLIGEDALAMDDASYFTASVLPASRLLLVSDQADEAEQIAGIICAPAEIDDPAAQYSIERIGYEDLAASRMDEFDGVMLLNPRADALREPELDRYRVAGGSVFIAVGDQLGDEAVSIGGWPTFQRRWRARDPGAFFELSSSPHPALATLAMIPGGVPFQDFRIHQYWQTAIPQGAQVLIRYAGTDHPALLDLSSATGASAGSVSPNERTGKTLVMTTPVPALAMPSSAWNELFQFDDYWPAFALVCDIARYVTGRSNEVWTSAVGAPVSITIQRAPSFDDPPRRLQWFPPHGNTAIPINLPERDAAAEQSIERILVGQPKQSGVHWIRGDHPGLGFTVNLSREQLATKPMDPAVIDRMFGPDVVHRIDSIEQMEWTSSQGGRVVSLWSPIMLTALVIFMLEQILSNHFYRRSAPAGAGVSGRRSVV